MKRGFVTTEGQRDQVTMATESNSESTKKMDKKTKRENSSSDEILSVRRRTETMSENGDVDVTPVVIEMDSEVNKAPDGGWGWWIIIACILLRIVVGGIGRSAGLFFLQFQERYGGGAAETAWVTSLAATTRLLTGPAVSLMCNKFSARQLVGCGTVFYVISLVISGFAPSTSFLYFSYGIIGGIGRSLVLTPVPILLGRYFDKRRSMAFGLSSSGFGIGGFAVTPLIEVLFLTYGFTGTFIILGGFGCHLFISAALFRPLTPNSSSNKTKSDESDEKNDDNNKEAADPLLSKSDTEPVKSTCDHSNDHTDNHGNNESTHKRKNGNNHSTADDKNSRLHCRRSTFQEKFESIKAAFKEDENSDKEPLIALSVLKDVRFLTLCIATLCFSLPTMGLFIPPLAKSRGLSALQAAYLISIIAGCDTVTRILSGFILDIKAVRNFRPIVYNAVTFFQIIPCFVFPSVRTFEGFAAVCVLHGSVMGVKASQRSVVLVDILGVDKLTSSFAILLMVQGIGTLAGPPVSGLLRDVSGSYDGAFYFAGSAILCGAFILLYGNIRNHFTKKKETDSESSETTESEEKV